MLKKLPLTLLVAGSLNEVLARAVLGQVRKGRDFADHIPFEKRSILPRDTQIAPKVFIISMVPSLSNFSTDDLVCPRTERLACPAKSDYKRDGHWFQSPLSERTLHFRP
jgi:hypothetical protein